jgi:hypothetical protein
VNPNTDCETASVLWTFSLLNILVCLITAVLVSRIVGRAADSASTALAADSTDVMAITWEVVNTEVWRRVAVTVART